MEFSGAVVDVDGTLIRGDRPIPDARRGLRALRDAGVEVAFVTNNPTRPPAAVSDHLRSLGFDVDPAEVVTSGTMTRRYLREHHPDTAVFVLGSAGLREQLDGVQFTADPAAADVYLASLDRAFDYDDVVDAMRALASEDTAFVGTDPDRTIPGDAGPLPGTGAILGAVGAAVGRDPTVVGKPSEHAAAAVADHLGVPANECLLVGDRLDTDIRLGATAGMTTAVVLSGIADRDEAARADPAPDHVLDSLADLPTLLSA